MRRIGLFGGSFDPPHNAHVEMARLATKEVPLDILFFVPAYEAPLKSHPPEARMQDRLAMVNIMAAMRPEWQVLTYEIDQERSVATIETVEYVRRQEPDATLFLLIGADQGEQFRKWYEWERLASMIHLICFSRAGYTPRLPTSTAQDVILFNSELSSSQIRELIKRGGDPAGTVPPQILSYLQNHHLYQ
ncbi:MAG: nicotinate (nicotinamide) nucleotide adenylyltransferase [Fidelibacterota bacterium]|nr:MAG: nicotinate (nicotinamide) nucleotide adenylyltransferase [Candidatus Neomarinimicrobiota bacterium]